MVSYADKILFQLFKLLNIDDTVMMHLCKHKQNQSTCWTSKKNKENILEWAMLQGSNDCVCIWLHAWVSKLKNIIISQLFSAGIFFTAVSDLFLASLLGHIKFSNIKCHSVLTLDAVHF